MITYHIISLFPEIIEPYLNASILKRAQEKGLIVIKYYNPRGFVLPSDISAKGGGKSKNAGLTYADRRIDDRPYGGGPGMVIEALPIMRAIEKALSNKIRNPKSKENSKFRTKKKKVKIIFFSPAGKQFTNTIADSFKKYTDIIFVCGRYEGVDARIKKVFPMVDISVGPYVLTGGELPSAIVIDAITRRIRGVLGDDSSIEEARIASPDVYTRPEVIDYKGKNYKVPKILLTGHHKNIDEWKNSRKTTNRPK